MILTSSLYVSNLILDLIEEVCPMEEVRWGEVKEMVARREKGREEGGRGREVSGRENIAHHSGAMVKAL